MNPQTSYPYKIIGVKKVFVITEISSATLHPNGYRNTTMSTISSTAALKCNSKGKNYTIGSKIEVPKFTKGSMHICRKCMTFSVTPSHCA